MRNYRIHHPYGGSLNHFCKPAQYMYEQVATVQALNLEHAFFLGQNDYNPLYRSANVRSTSVGDIIQDNEGNCYLVSSIGFQEVPSTWLTYIDWGVVKSNVELV